VQIKGAGHGLTYQYPEKFKDCKDIPRNYLTVTRL
jgi:hypothetical protein